MSRVSLARQLLSDAGQKPVYVPATLGGHQVENDGRVILHIRYEPEDVGAAEEVEVTICTGFRHDGLKLADRVIALQPGESVFIGPFDMAIYNQPGTREIHIDYSAVEGVYVAVLQLPR